MTFGGKGGEVSGRALIEGAHNAFGRLDSVGCNAGITIAKPTVDYTPDEWGFSPRPNPRFLSKGLG